MIPMDSNIQRPNAGSSISFDKNNRQPRRMAAQKAEAAVTKDLQTVETWVEAWENGVVLDTQAPASKKGEDSSLLADFIKRSEPPTLTSDQVGGRPRRRAAQKAEAAVTEHLQTIESWNRCAVLDTPVPTSKSKASSLAAYTKRRTAPVTGSDQDTLSPPREPQVPDGMPRTTPALMHLSRATTSNGPYFDDDWEDDDDDEDGGLSDDELDLEECSVIEDSGDQELVVLGRSDGFTVHIRNRLLR